MDRKKQEAIGVFRYGIIAPVLHSGGQGQAEYFRRLAQKELDVPFHGLCLAALNLGALEQRQTLSEEEVYRASTGRSCARSAVEKGIVYAEPGAGSAGTSHDRRVLRKS